MTADQKADREATVALAVIFSLILAISRRRSATIGTLGFAVFLSRVQSAGRRRIERELLRLAGNVGAFDRDVLRRCRDIEAARARLGAELEELAERVERWEQHQAEAAQLSRRYSESIERRVIALEAAGQPDPEDATT